MSSLVKSHFGTFRESIQIIFAVDIFFNKLNRNSFGIVFLNNMDPKDITKLVKITMEAFFQRFSGIKNYEITPSSIYVSKHFLTKIKHLIGLNYLDLQFFVHLIQCFRTRCDFFFRHIFLFFMSFRR